MPDQPKYPEQFYTSWNQEKDHLKVSWGDYNSIIMNSSLALLSNDPTLAPDQPAKVRAFTEGQMPDMSELEVNGFIVFGVSKLLQEALTAPQKLIPLDEAVKQIEVEVLLRSIDPEPPPPYQPSVFCLYHPRINRGCFEVHWQCCMDVWMGAHIYSELRGPLDIGVAVGLAYDPKNPTKFVGVKFYFDNEVDFVKQVLDEIS